MKTMSREQAMGKEASLPSGTYFINEVFYSIQGEGTLTGTPMIFIRFGSCNLRCDVTNEAAFSCDTEFVSGRAMNLDALWQEIVDGMQRRVSPEYSATWPRSTTPLPAWFLLTGGEPALQVDAALIDFLRQSHPHVAHIAIETNGTIALPEGIDHVCVSPKTAEHTLRQLDATELKYVRHAGQALPKDTRVRTQNYLVSPACQPDGSFRREDIAWCVQLVLDNPKWRLSIQQHKLLGVR